jgi:predicted NBD/HSP70 family sugar kinase
MVTATATSDDPLRGGVDLGGTKIEAIILDAEHRRRGSARSTTPTDGGPEQVAARIADVLMQAAREAKVAPSKLIGIGVGSPGDVNDGAGTGQRRKPSRLVGQLRAGCRPARAPRGACAPG